MTILIGGIVCIAFVACFLSFGAGGEVVGKAWKKKLEEMEREHECQLEEAKKPPALPPTPFTEGYRGNYDALARLVESQRTDIEAKDELIRCRDRELAAIKETIQRLCAEEDHDGHH